MTIAILGAASIVAGVVLQQLFAAGFAAAAWSSGAQLDQSILQGALTIGQLIAAILVPMGAAMVGVGWALHLGRRPTASTPVQAAKPDHDDRSEAHA